MMTKGSIVIYKDPQPDEMRDGEPLQFIVDEMNGDRCFISPKTSNLSIKPQTLARVEDLEEVS